MKFVCKIDCRGIKHDVKISVLHLQYLTKARLAQLVERKALNLVVVGSNPTVGVSFLLLIDIVYLTVFTF